MIIVMEMKSKQKKSEIKRMVDIHTHCLPKVDDGPKSIEESKKMLRESFSQGIEICVATPHCVIHRQTDLTSFLEKRNRRYSELQKELEQDKPQYPKIKLGAEVYFDNDISKYDDIKNLCITDSSYMLVEVPYGIKTAMLSEWTYNLFLKGINPIIAHIDRYENWREIICDMDNEKIIYQVNASRFLSFGGRRFIKKLCGYNDSFIVSSDMHNMTSRKCNMRKAYEKALKRYGDLADDMFGNTARKIIEG